MKGKWKVSHNYAGGEMLIQVYRQLDVTEPDHAGNREYKPGFFETDEEAQALADSLNTKHWKISYSMLYRNGSVQEARRCRMADLISRQAAIDALHMHLMYRMGTDSNKKRLDDWINSLPSAQGKPFNLPEIYIADGYDTIEGEDGNVGFGVYVPDENQIYVAGDVEGEIRARALLHEICHWVQAMCGRSFDEDEANEFSDIVYDALPSAQETHEERTETHACDLISRQAAIDATKKHYRAHDNDLLELIAFDIEQLPSVQPENIYCKDCGHRDDHGCCKYWKALAIGDIPIATDDNDFCSYAERRTDG